MKEKIKRFCLILLLTWLACSKCQNSNLLKCNGLTPLELPGRYSDQDRERAKDHAFEALNGAVYALQLVMGCIQR